jgi:2-methylcitrate dehydratase PrpD
LHAVRNAPVPPLVAERIGWTLLDGFAVMQFGKGVATAEPFLRTFGDRVGAPVASVPVLGSQLAAESAAAVNAFLIHAAEIDDSDLRGQLRASAVVLPTALAAAELVDARGADFVRALALGYTLQGRFTAPIPVPIQSRGWMASGVWGPPAAAAAAALLMGLSPAQIASAIGLAGSDAGGLFQYFFDQSEEKRLIMARAARAAVESARLAQAGEIGPARIIEGRAGLYALFAGVPAPEATAFTSELAAMEGPLFIYPKLYAASHSIIPTLDGMAADLPRTFRWQDVASYVVRGDQGWADTVGSKIVDYKAPESTIGAMINYGFVVAMYLIRGSVMPADYSAALRDPRIDAFARRGSFEVQPSPSDLSVEFRMRDGRTYLAKAQTPGPRDQSPLDAQRRLQKVAALTPDWTAARRDQLAALCHSVAAAPSMRGWVRDVAALFRG